MDDQRVQQVNRNQSRLDAADQLYEALRTQTSVAIAALEEAAAYCKSTAGSELGAWDEIYFDRVITNVRCLPAKVQAIYLMTPEVASKILEGEALKERASFMENNRLSSAGS